MLIWSYYFQQFIIIKLFNENSKYNCMQTVMHFFRILWLIESSKEQKNLFQSIFFNITNTVTVPFEQFNSSLLNKITNFFKETLLTQNVAVYIYLHTHIYIYIKHQSTYDYHMQSNSIL